jgi:hypothetical protein
MVKGHGEGARIVGGYGLQGREPADAGGEFGELRDGEVAIRN